MAVDLEQVTRLLEHLRWADAEVEGAMLRLEEVPARALELFAHVLGAELIWLDRIEGAEQSVAVWPAVDLDGCADLARRARRRFELLLETLAGGDLARSVTYRNSAGDVFESDVGDILIHVALHGAYHRGQVALLLRSAELEPAPTDYIGFVRGAPAAVRSDANHVGEEKG